MAKARAKKQTRAKGALDNGKNTVVRTLQVNKEDDVKSLYANVRAAFTASDLQRYTEDEEMVPADQLVEELAAIVRQWRKCKNKRSAQ